MQNTIDEFRFRAKYLENLHFNHVDIRISDFYTWMIKNDELKSIIDNISSRCEIVKDNKLTKTPSSPDEIGAFGIYLMKEINNGTEAYELSHKFHIDPPFNTDMLQDISDELMDRYIYPTLEIIEHELENSNKIEFQYTVTDINTVIPPEITESLEHFKRDYPDINNNAFIMMRFGDTKIHNKIYESIKRVLQKYGLNALRADDKEYHDDLFSNVLTYIYGCKFGIAVFERLEEEHFNPNVSLEVGYFSALKKQICLLKDKNLKTLQTDLIGKLYKSFDPYDIDKSIPKQLEKWLKDKEII